LQLADQEPQLLDLGLRCIMLGAKGVPLGYNSIVRGLQRYERGILSGDDFSHLLQMTKQLIRVSWKIIKH
jgi:hypothetical protein